MEVDNEDDQKTDGGIVYKWILINAKLQIENIEFKKQG
jgi:hypothetical protein